MDSLTRFAQAQREIGLAVGEPPATKGYPPSVFAKLPQLVERAGNGDAGQGSITALLHRAGRGRRPARPDRRRRARASSTATSCCRASWPRRGQYPAIDVEASRQPDACRRCTSPSTWRWRASSRGCTRPTSRPRDLISVGAYQAGSDPRVDRAIARWPKIRAFLGQNIDESVSLAASLEALIGVIGATIDDGAAARADAP